MSKHPASELTPRDIACIEYGQRLDDLITYHYPYRHHAGGYGRLCNAIDSCRWARERIFRECDNCVHEDALDCTVRKERLIDCYGYKELAPTCRYYKERREV